MKKVLITGASGFLGSNVITRAAKETDWDIYALVSGRHSMPLIEDVKQVTANLLDPESIERVMAEIKPDILIHLAWNLEGNGYRASQNNLVWLEASLHILRVFANNGGKRFFFAGSSSEYGRESAEMCIETVTTSPVDLYGMCKNSFCRVAKMFCDANSIEFLSGRFFTVYGKGDRHLYGLIPSAIDSLVNNEEFFCKEPNKEWSFLYIDDAADSIIAAVESNFTGVFNIANDPVTIRDALRYVAMETGNGDKLQFAESSTPVCNGLVADVSTLRETIGFTPKVGLQEGIGHTVRWWKSETVGLSKEKEP